MTDKLRAAAKAALDLIIEDDRNADKCVRILEAALAEPEPDAYGYASRLAVALSEKHYKATAANWKPLPDLMGVLTQIDNMTASLARQEAEPVAWYHDDFGVLELNRHERVGWSPLYPAPPRREWVGLTDEDISQWIEEEHDVLRWAEAKLREKNT